ncbi:MAG: C40 family peptidase [Desulfovibrionaceae bacterium]
MTFFLGACAPKTTKPADDVVLHNTTRAALANAQMNDDDDDDDGAWEPENSSQLSQKLARGYSRTDMVGKGSTGDLLQKARTALGTPYVSGGTSRRGGFDCSGFVQWSYNHVGIQLPRTAREQAQVGKFVRRVDDMQAGDIVAFKHPRRGYHTGIYVGDGKFIHSPRKRNVVRINSLDDPYFSQTLMGARRLNVSNEGDIEAAEKMLVAYAHQAPSPKNVTSRSSKSKKSTLASRESKKKSDKNSRRSADRDVKDSKKAHSRLVAARDEDKADKVERRSKSSTKERKVDKGSKSTKSDKSDKTRKLDKKDSSRQASASKSQKSSSDSKKSGVSGKKSAKNTDSKTASRKKAS